MKYYGKVIFYGIFLASLASGKITIFFGKTVKTIQIKEKTTNLQEKQKRTCNVNIFLTKYLSFSVFHWIFLQCRKVHFDGCSCVNKACYMYE